MARVVAYRPSHPTVSCEYSSLWTPSRALACLCYKGSWTLPVVGGSGNHMSSNLLAALSLCGLFCTAGTPVCAQAPAKVLEVVPSADAAELDPAHAANQIGRI